LKSCLEKDFGKRLPNSNTHDNLHDIAIKPQPLSTYRTGHKAVTNT